MDHQIQFPPKSGYVPRVGGRRVRKTCFASPTEHRYHVNRRGITGRSEWQPVDNVVGKAQSPAFNVMALDDTDQIPISLVPIAMVRRLRLVPSAAAVESLADLGTIANLWLLYLTAMATRSASPSKMFIDLWPKSHAVCFANKAFRTGLRLESLKRR